LEDLNKPTCILAENESIINLKNACYHFFQNILSTRFRLKKHKDKKYTEQ